MGKIQKIGENGVAQEHSLAGEGVALVGAENQTAGKVGRERLGKTVGKAYAKAGGEVFLHDPLGKAKTKHHVFLQAFLAGGRLALGGDVLSRQEGGKVARVAKALAKEVGIGRRTQAEVFLAIPVFQIVTGFIPFFRKIADLVLQKAVLLEQTGAEKVHLARFLLVGQEQAITHAAKGRALLHREAVGRDVVGREREQGAQGVEIAFPCLVRNAQHHVGREIGKACLTCALCRAAEVVEGVRAAKRL